MLTQPQEMNGYRGDVGLDGWNSHGDEWERAGGRRVVSHLVEGAGGIVAWLMS